MDAPRKYVPLCVRDLLPPDAELPAGDSLYARMEWYRDALEEMQEYRWEHVGHICLRLSMFMLTTLAACIGIALLFQFHPARLENDFITRAMILSYAFAVYSFVLLMTMLIRYLLYLNYCRERHEGDPDAQAEIAGNYKYGLAELLLAGHLDYAAVLQPIAPFYRKLYAIPGEGTARGEIRLMCLAAISFETFNKYSALNRQTCLLRAWSLAAIAGTVYTIAQVAINLDIEMGVMFAIASLMVFVGKVLLFRCNWLVANIACEDYLEQALDFYEYYGSLEAVDEWYEEDEDIDYDDDEVPVDLVD